MIGELTEGAVDTADVYAKNLKVEREALFHEVQELKKLIVYSNRMFQKEHTKNLKHVNEIIRLRGENIELKKQLGIVLGSKE